MGELLVLDANVGSERCAWLDHWHRWPEREVSAHPDYVRLFTRSCDRAMCAVMEDVGGCVLFPFILRPLAAEPWTCAGTSSCDIITPYGYGGPFAYGRPDAGAFWSQLERWANQANVVSAFARRALSEQMIPFAGTVEFSRSNIVRRLDLDDEAIWLDYEYKVRKNVNKARRCGLEVEIDLEANRLDDFLNVYYATMDRRNAQDQYHFPASLFRSIVQDLRGHFAFFHTLHDGLVVSSELVLVSAQYVYSFLGGTLTRGIRLPSK